MRIHTASGKDTTIYAKDTAELIEKERAVAAGKAEEDRKTAEAEGKIPRAVP